MTSDNDTAPTVILGGGLTGLTAAYLLNQRKVPIRVIEAESQTGGASRTVRFNDFLFDLGGHRFYTRNKEVLKIVEDLLGNEILEVSRKSHIFLNNRFVEYPLSFFNALSALGIVTSLAVVRSYVWERTKRLFFTPPEATFEQWVVSRFGRRLYEIYFKPYSEKVWGIPCTELGSDFAAQRIKGMSLREALKNMLIKNNAPASLVTKFLYPSRGFGRIPEAIAQTLPELAVDLQTRVTKIEHDGGRVTHVSCLKNNSVSRLEVDHVISTIPIDELVRGLSPAPPQEIIDAVSGLRYRDMVIIFLTLNRKQVTEDHWIYFPTEQFFSRIHEPQNWSKEMSPTGSTSLVVEVFCFEDDAVFKEDNKILADQAAKRLADLGLIHLHEVSGYSVVRLKKAYPLYVEGYQYRLNLVCSYLRRLTNLQLAGRNGIYKYTSADFYMEMGLRAAENVMGANHNLDLISSEKEYAEK